MRQLQDCRERWRLQKTRHEAHVGMGGIQSHLPVLQCVSTRSPSVFFSWTALKMAAAPNAPIAKLAFTSSASMASADEMYSCQMPESRIQKPEAEVE